jgi:hypothetical protein
MIGQGPHEVKLYCVHFCVLFHSLNLHPVRDPQPIHEDHEVGRGGHGCGIDQQPDESGLAGDPADRLRDRLTPRGILTCPTNIEQATPGDTECSADFWIRQVENPIQSNLNGSKDQVEVGGNGNAEPPMVGEELPDGMLGLVGKMKDTAEGRWTPTAAVSRGTHAADQILRTRVTRHGGTEPGRDDALTAASPEELEGRPVHPSGRRIRLETVRSHRAHLVRATSASTLDPPPDESQIPSLPLRMAIAGTTAESHRSCRKARRFGRTLPVSEQRTVMRSVGVHDSSWMASPRDDLTHDGVFRC